MSDDLSDPVLPPNNSQCLNSVPTSPDVSVDPDEPEEDDASLDNGPVTGGGPVSRTVSDSSAITGTRRVAVKEPRSRSVTFYDSMTDRWQEKRKLQRTPTPYWPRKDISPTDDGTATGESFDDDLGAYPSSSSNTELFSSLNPGESTKLSPIYSPAPNSAVKFDCYSQDQQNNRVDADTNVVEQSISEIQIKEQIVNIDCESKKNSSNEFIDNENKESNINGNISHQETQQPKSNIQDKDISKCKKNNKLSDLSPKKWFLSHWKRGKEPKQQEVSTQDADIPELHRNPLFVRAAASLEEDDTLGPSQSPITAPGPRKKTKSVS